MGPSARLRAVQELLEPLCQGPDFLPADQALQNYFRTRRYIGSKDRRAIRDIFYMILHCWHALAFSLGKAKTPVSGRMLLLGFLKARGGLDGGLFREGKYGLEPLTKSEKTALSAINPGKNLPEWAAANCPEWLYAGFETRFGKKTGEELAALNARAPVDIRLNTLKGGALELRAALKKLGFTPCKYAKNGYRRVEEIQLTHSDDYKNGLFEFQDEGSQLASILVDAKPGGQVIDLCAGAGGKTLALAAGMANKGQIFAFDIDPGKIRTLKARAQKAGVRNLQASVLPEPGPEQAKIMADFEGKMDRVLLDVPCSGTGVWRRKPDTRLRLTPEKLDGYKPAQAALLGEGAGLVRPGGRLAYVTCSLLAEENEDQVSGFLETHPGWEWVDYRDKFKAKAPETRSSQKDALLLTPARHATDGFFVAILEKRVV